MCEISDNYQSSATQFKTSRVYNVHYKAEQQRTVYCWSWAQRYWSNLPKLPVARPSVHICFSASAYAGASHFKYVQWCCIDASI